MNDDEAVLDELAGAVLDGVAVDWDAADVSATLTDRPLVGRLRLIAGIAQAHREDAPGTWGPLRLLERLGRGTFGEVYRAWDPRLDREVALKLLSGEGSTASARASSIIEEGRLLARVRHPNVVTIHGAEQIGDRIGLWMEFVDGRTLHDLVAGDGRRFSPTEVEAIGRSLCAAVAAVHGAGLLHRDITARNVMLAGDGRVVLMDFGSGADSAATVTSALAGTPLYLAPELLAGAGRPSVQSDIYSIGVLLYFLLTGSYPVRGVDLDGIRAAHARGERRALMAAPVRVPGPLRRAVERAIDPRPDRRFDSTATLSAALDDRPKRWSAAGRAAALALVLAAGGAAVWSGRLAREAARAGDGAEASTPRTDAGRSDAETRSREFRSAWAMAEREGAPGPRQAAARFADLIAADPGYAPAHAGLVLAHAYLSMNPYQGLTFAQTLATMRAAALEAVRLDPTLAEAHVARGWVHARELEWPEAERAFREAIRLNPKLTAAYTSLAISTLQPLGRLEDADRLLREAGRVDPHAQSVPLTLGRVLLYANRPAEAIAVLEPLEPARNTDANFLLVDVFLGRALVQVGRATEALPLLERQRQRLVDPATTPDPWAAWAYAALARRADAEALATTNDHLPFRRAIINGALGRDERMFHGLEEMAEREPQRLPQLLRAPELAGYRRDPRFRRLVERLRLDGAPW